MNEAVLLTVVSGFIVTPIVPVIIYFAQGVNTYVLKSNFIHSFLQNNNDFNKFFSDLSSHRLLIDFFFFLLIVAIFLYFYRYSNALESIIISGIILLVLFIIRPCIAFLSAFLKNYIMDGEKREVKAKNNICLETIRMLFEPNRNTEVLNFLIISYFGIYYIAENESMHPLIVMPLIIITILMAILQFFPELLSLGSRFFDPTQERGPFRSLSEIGLSTYIRFYDYESKLKSITCSLSNGKSITGIPIKFEPLLVLQYKPYGSPAIRYHIPWSQIVYFTIP
ncbi:MAG: hypothetical protein QW608_01165 [Thermoplasmata archaeon]